MGYIVRYGLPGGVRGEKYVASKSELEEWKRRTGAKVYAITEKKPSTPKREIVKVDTRTGRSIRVEVGEHKDVEKLADSALKYKYGVSMDELKRIVETSKSQPEAIMKLRQKLHGSTKYDPRYFEVEKLLTQLYDQKEHGYIPGVKERVESVIKSVAVKNTPGARVENGKVVVKPKEDVVKNVGVKTVPTSTSQPTPKPASGRIPERLIPKPVPQPKPEPKQVITTATAPSTKPKLDTKKLALIGGGLLAAYILFKALKR